MFSPLIDGACLIWIYMSVLFVLAQVRRDNSLADIGWGLGFVLLAGWMHVFHGHPLSWLPLLLVGLWGVRLALHIAVRNRRQGGEDWRYARWREQWGRWAVPRAYLQVFLLQGGFMWVIALPLMQRPGGGGLAWFQWVGVLVWAAGLIWEAVADWQLLRFKADPANRGRIMTEGLWRLSRHPNYFGEIVLWWGLFLVMLPWGIPWLSLASPLTITWLLTRVSGVPLLEEKYRDNPAYRAYVRQTNALLPDLRKWKQPTNS